MIKKHPFYKPQKKLRVRSLTKSQTRKMTLVALDSHVSQPPTQQHEQTHGYTHVYRARERERERERKDRKGQRYSTVAKEKTDKK